MKKGLWLVLLLGMGLLLACGAGSSSGEAPQGLKVGDGTATRTYTVDDLAALPAAESTFQEVVYKGVPLPVLLQDAGFDSQAIKAVKAVAADGYSVNYDPALFQRQDVLVAYATAQGALAADDGALRMVVPDAEGKLNVRMLAELQVFP